QLATPRIACPAIALEEDEARHLSVLRHLLFESREQALGVLHIALETVDSPATSNLRELSRGAADRRHKLSIVGEDCGQLAAHTLRPADDDRVLRGHVFLRGPDGATAIRHATCFSTTASR